MSWFGKAGAGAGAGFIIPTEKDLKEREDREEARQARQSEEQKQRALRTELQKHEKETEERDRAQRLAEEKRAQEEQKKKLEREEEAAKKEKIEMKQLGQTLQNLRLKHCKDSVTSSDVEELAKCLEASRLRELVGQLGSETGDAVTKGLTAAVSAMAETKHARKSKEEAVPSGPEWTPEELTKLAKGLQKFPGGVPRRWKVISDYMVTRSPEEVVEKARELAQGSSLKTMGSTYNEKAFESFKKEKDSRPPPPQTEADVRLDDLSPVGTAEEEDVWSAEQQQALEQALQQFPTSMAANERWAAIADAVPNKSKKQCVARFKNIREAVMKQKTSN
eukprot:Platyproteum_vivax@DN6654_c0_g1_i1.p2